LLRDPPAAESHEGCQFPILPHLAIDEELGWVFWCREESINTLYGHRFSTERPPNPLPVTHDGRTYKRALHEKGESGTVAYPLQLIMRRLSVQACVVEMMSHSSCYTSHEKGSNNRRCCPVYVPLCYLASSPVQQRLSIRIHQLASVKRVHCIRRVSPRLHRWPWALISSSKRCILSTGVLRRAKVRIGAQASTPSSLFVKIMRQPRRRMSAQAARLACMQRRSPSI
jgi:hypothetical protein